MGWLFFTGMTRQSLVQKLIAPKVYEAQDGPRREETLAHCLTRESGTDVLWAVQRFSRSSQPPKTILVCFLLEGSPNGWGYKELTESEHPYYYTCPLKYLELAPETCAEWREHVRGRHAGTPQSRTASQPLPEAFP
jgi:hypothetical protein